MNILENRVNFLCWRGQAANNNTTILPKLIIHSYYRDWRDQTADSTGRLRFT